MIRPLIFGIAILTAGATQVMAQGVPSFNVELGCQQASSGPGKLTTFGDRGRMRSHMAHNDRIAVRW